MEKPFLQSQEFISGIVHGVRAHPHTALIIEALIEFELSRVYYAEPKFDGAAGGIPVTINEGGEPGISICMPKNWLGDYGNRAKSPD